MSAVPSQASSTLWSSVLQPAIMLSTGTYSSYKTIAKSPVFNWSPECLDQQSIRMQKAVTLLFSTCLGLGSVMVYKAARKYVENKTFKEKFIVHILGAIIVSQLRGKIASNFIPFCQKIQTLVESNLYPLLSWQKPKHHNNFLPFPFNLTTKSA